MAKKITAKGMSDAHKSAMEVGRSEGRAVREYLEALRANKPRRGRKRTPESIEARLAVITEQLAEASAIDELKLVQERRDLEAELAALGEHHVDIDTAEAAFVSVARSYADRKGIAYASWREVGVPAAVLTKAGITRSS